MPDDYYSRESRNREQARIGVWKALRAMAYKRAEAHKYDRYPESMRGETPEDRLARARYDADHPRYIGGGNPYKSR